LSDAWNPKRQLFWPPECSYTHTLEDLHTVNTGIWRTNRCTQEDRYWLLL
jgi:hypothetical protein